MTGYGLQRYGLDGYGSAASAISVAAAYAIDTHTVRVVLSAEPRHASQFAIGDALNPTTWTVQNEVTGAYFTVLGVLTQSSQSFDLVLFEPLGSRFVTHVVATGSLLSAGGYPATNPRSAEFLGVVEEHDPVRASVIQRYRDVDLRNPPYSTTGISGSLVIGSASDYLNEDGIPLVRKLVFRRLVTPRGSIKHLPNYGLGILEKEPVPGGNVTKLRVEVELQVRQEPDVQSCAAKVSFLDARNILTIDLSIVIARTGAALDFGVKVRDQQVVER